VVVSVLAIGAVLARQAEIQFGRSDDKNVEGYYRMAEVLHARPVEGAVGVPQSGVVGYFCECAFVALDGKVNGLVAEALRSHRLEDFLREHDVERIADHFPWMVDLVLSRTEVRPTEATREPLVANGRVVGLAVALEWP